ncbi:MAG: hypothetical protein HY581_03515 [Nitrospirae bacterium]|nr:hypothetical protein [Nitrospirota bacterium]
MTRFAVAMVLLAGLAGCGELPSRSYVGLGSAEGYWIPLTVSLRLDPTVTEAGLDYTDSCLQRRTLPLGDRLKDSLTRGIGLVFERVQATAPTSTNATADGVVAVSLELKELDLFIPRKESKSYAATVTLGASFSYVDSDGSVLYSKKLRTEAKGQVETDGRECDVRGLAALAQQAVATLAQGIKKHLGTSMKIQQAAEERKGSRPTAKAIAGSPQVPPFQDLKARSFDVDQIPEGVHGYEQRKAVGIAIGVGTFRDPDVPAVEFAAHDATVMAGYFRTVGGIPSQRLKVVTDEHALKEDLAEVLEDWLPRQVASSGSVLVYFSGRAVVDPSTGAVSLFPHEGTPASSSRLFSLRRMHTALARLPIQRAVLFLDLALTDHPAYGAQIGRTPVWLAQDPALRDGKLVQIIGVSKHQRLHQTEAGQHGPFTYYLLRGLGGAADEDGNGVVAIGELVDYLRAEMPEPLNVKNGSAQEFITIPMLTPEAKAWGIPIARVK